MKELIHYTSLINALQILFSRKIVMGRIDQSNDYLELNSISEDCRTIFLFCCSLEPLNASMWLSYSGRKNGAAIIFEFNSNYDYQELLIPNHGYTHRSFEMNYTDSYEEDIGSDLCKIGEWKDSKFKGEREYRYLIDLDCEFDSKFCVDCELNTDSLVKITLVVDRRNKKMVERILKSFDYKEGFIEVIENDFIN